MKARDVLEVRKMLESLTTRELDELIKELGLKDDRFEEFFFVEKSEKIELIIENVEHEYVKAEEVKSAVKTFLE